METALFEPNEPTIRATVPAQKKMITGIREPRPPVEWAVTAEITDRNKNRTATAFKAIL